MVKLNKKRTNKLAGFSFLEMVISVFIFSLVIVMVVSVFVNFVKIRKKSSQVQRDMENVSTALSQMSKNARNSYDLEDYDGVNGIRMYSNVEGEAGCVYYHFNTATGALEIGRAATGDPADCPNGPDGAYNAITEGNITDFRFDVTETTPLNNPDTIGKMTVKMKMNSQTIQTSVSFREYSETSP